MFEFFLSVEGFEAQVAVVFAASVLILVEVCRFLHTLLWGAGEAMSG